MSGVGSGGTDPVVEPSSAMPSGSGGGSGGSPGGRNRLLVAGVLVVFAALVAVPFVVRARADQTVDLDRDVGTGGARTGLLALAEGDEVVGNDPTGKKSTVLWAAISGPYTVYENGDPFAVKCLDQTNNATPGAACGSAGSNPEYRPEGYLYGIDVGEDAVGSTLTVSLFDAGHYDRRSGPRDPDGQRVDRSQFPYGEPQDLSDVTPMTDATRSSPRGTDARAQPLPGVTTSYEVFAPGGPLDDATDGSSLGGRCSDGPGRVVIPPEADDAIYKNQWSSLCTLTVTTPGTYHLRVKSSAIAGIEDSGSGWNQYLVKATTSAGTSSIFALGDISVYMTNEVYGSRVDFPLAAVPASRAGRHLRVRLFDPGDGSGVSGTTVAVTDPVGGSPPCLVGPDGQAAQLFTACSFPTRQQGSSSGLYNGRWLSIDVDLPADYACSTDCTWHISFEWGRSMATDRATWEATITDADPDVPVIGTVPPGTVPRPATIPRPPASAPVPVPPASVPPGSTPPGTFGPRSSR